MEDKPTAEKRFWDAFRRVPLQRDVPPFFSRRVMAAVRSMPPLQDPAIALVRDFWRAAASSLGVMFLACTLSWFMDHRSQEHDPAANDIELAMLQSLESDGEIW